MKNILECKGDLVNIDGHNIHIYTQGNKDKPKIVLMSGSGTVAPVYDFKVLYEKLDPKQAVKNLMTRDKKSE